MIICMSTQPLVSVVMPNHNNENFLREAIESIINQSYHNFEIIIVDDCSTDSSWQIIQEFANKDKRIKAFRNEENMKIVRTRNKAFNEASKNSKYYAIFDSDDISMPERLEKQVEFLENNSDYAGVGSNLYIIGEKSEYIGKRDYPSTYEDIRRNILFYNPFPQPVMMIRKNIIDNMEITYSDAPEYEGARDYEMWFRIFDNYKLANLNEYLLKYRVSTTQGKNRLLKRTLKSTINVQKMWMFNRKYFSLLFLFYYVIEYILLLIPKSMIFRMFKLVGFRK